MHLHSAEQAEQFRLQLREKSDGEVMAFFAHPTEHDADVLMCARQELQRRGLPLDAAARVEAEARARLAEQLAVDDPASIYGHSYIERHWHGALSLAHSYWINCVLVNVVFAWLIAALPALSGTLPLLALSLVAIVAWALLIAINVWQIVGTWRSASRQVDEGGARFWPMATRILLVFTAFGLVVRFFGVAVPQVSGYFDIIRGDPVWGKTEVTVLPSGTEIEFKGSIRVGSSAQFADALAAAPRVTCVYLDTPGGRVAEAEKIADLVRARGLDTYVESHCASAGTLIFLAGRNRILRGTARLGFHSGSFPGASPRLANEVTIARLRGVGASPAFIQRAITTSPSSMWYPPGQELRAEKIVTRITTGFDMPLGTDWLETVTEARLRRLLARSPLQRAIAAKEPRAYDTALRGMLERLGSGETIDSAMREVDRVIEGAVWIRRSQASNEALFLYLKFLKAVVAQNRLDAPNETLLFARGDPDAMRWDRATLRRKLPHWPKEAEDAYRTAVLIDEPDYSEFDANISYDSDSSFFAQYYRAPSGYSYVSTQPADRETQSEYCQVYDEYFGHLLTLPAGRLVRQARVLIIRRGEPLAVAH